MERVKDARRHDNIKIKECIQEIRGQKFKLKDMNRKLAEEKSSLHEHNTALCRGLVLMLECLRSKIDARPDSRSGNWIGASVCEA